MKPSKDEQETETHRVLFEGFKFKEEHEQALRRLEKYLAKLKDWDTRAKIIRDVPPRMLN